MTHLTSTTKLQTIKQGFIDRGEALTEFCRKNDLDYQVTSQVLNGRLKGTRGQSHRAAVLLGLKPDPSRQKRKGSGTSAEAPSV